jgi:pimeloyl-ACP methyl ester carboxylesterase
VERDIDWEGAPGSAVLRLPEGEVRAGLVTLHGAGDGHALHPLFDQLGQHLTNRGLAVLSYDRRSVGEGDTPFVVQAQDAVAAMRALAAELSAPVGVFGYSQGAWAATIAAADEAARFLVVLGCSGVSPAEQMRFHTDELLRRHGFDGQVRAQNRELRERLEGYLRTSPRDPTGRDELAATLREISQQPWFRYAYLPEAPLPTGWAGTTWTLTPPRHSRRCGCPSWRCGGQMRNAFPVS